VRVAFKLGEAVERVASEVGVAAVDLLKAWFD
jgi:hypothetical protein